MEITKFVTPEIIFGSNSISQIGDCILRLGGTKAFIVTDPGVIKAGWVKKAVAYISECGINYHIFSDITNNPKDYEVMRATKEYKRVQCDIVVGIGGGSCLDSAKAVALLSANEGVVHEFQGIDKIENPLPPMIMVPTTAGSGADISQFCIITNTEKKVKIAIISKSLIPDISIIDPTTLITKEPIFTAYTGMDALTHAIEAYLSIASTPLTDLLALDAIRLISGNLRQSVRSKTDITAKKNIAMASQQAAMAFSNAILGAVHAMSHPLGGLLDMPHGEANSILLPHVMEFNKSAVPHKYTNIAIAMGENVEGLSDTEAALQAINSINRLARDIGIPKRLSEVGLQKKYISQLSECAMEDACLITNPKEVTQTDIEDIFKEAF
jgi:alcohol dehydrogenase class IV